MSRRTRTPGNLAAVIAVGVSLACAGCAEHNVHAGPLATTPQPQTQHPMNIAPDTDASPPQPAETPAPEVSSESEAPPLTSIVKPRTPPAPPKPVTEQPAAEPTSEPAAHAPAAPQIIPQLSQSDQQTFERRTNDEMATAERNLQQANGRQLNASQQDLREKARSFLDQARDASKSGDWARAQNLAQKARVLSAELLNSL